MFVRTHMIGNLNTMYFRDKHTGFHAFEHNYSSEYMITIMDVTKYLVGIYSERKMENPQIIYPEIGRPGNDSLHWKKKKNCMYNDSKYAFLCTNSASA